MYREAGKMKLDEYSPPVDTYQNYLYTLTDNTLDIHFIESTTPIRLFHSVQLNTVENILSGSAKHKCIDDYYDGTYKFDLSNSTIQIQYTVNGANKQYTSNCIYTVEQ